MLKEFRLKDEPEFSSSSFQRKELKPVSSSRFPVGCSASKPGALWGFY